MEVKETAESQREKDNPIRNFCWPLKGKDREECVQSYEDVFEEEEAGEGESDTLGK